LAACSRQLRSQEKLLKTYTLVGCANYFKNSGRGGVAAGVLVADDNPVVREVIAWQLIAQGYRLTQAPDGSAALAELEAAMFRIYS
jgi:PleD family two-component response regulator